MAIVLAIALPWLGSGCVDAETGPPRPSVIVILIDTLRKDRLSLYGYAKPTSPGLERLARESVTFDRCLAPSPWTKPSTASLMTGLYPSGHGAWAKRMAAPELEFLSEVLRDEGYATAGFSGNPYVSAAFGMDQGFEHFELDGGKNARDYADISALLGSARRWLDTPREQPFFLYIHVMNVHGPYRAPASYRERFAEEPSQPFEFQGPLWKSVTRDKASSPSARAVTRGHLNTLNAQYDGAIAYTDDQLSLFIEDLRTRGVLDESILVITSDHGEELYDHENFGHHRTLHSEVLDVPLMLRLPGARAGGQRVDAIASLIDVPATILDAAGLLDARPGGRFGEGRSLLASLASPDSLGPSAEPRTLLSELRGPLGRRGSLVQRWPHRMAQMEFDRANDSTVFELYDVARDPREVNDLATSNSDLVGELGALLQATRDAIEVQAPEGDVVEPDEEMRRRLEALGYGD